MELPFEEQAEWLGKQWEKHDLPTVDLPQIELGLKSTKDYKVDPFGFYSGLQPKTDEETALWQPRHYDPESKSIPLLKDSPAEMVHDWGGQQIKSVKEFGKDVYSGAGGVYEDIQEGAGGLAEGIGNFWGKNRLLIYVVVGLVAYGVIKK